MPEQEKNTNPIINAARSLGSAAGKIASQGCSPTDDLRGSEHYKRAIIGTLVKRAALKAYERALGK